VLVDGKKRPFTVGRVVDALQTAGVPTDDALRVAAAVEHDLRAAGVTPVPIENLQHAVTGVLRTELGAEVAERYVQQTPPFQSIFVERPNGKTVPFSNRKLASSIERSGLGVQDAWLLSQQVEHALRAEGLVNVPQDAVLQRAAVLVETRFGRQARVRYEASAGHHAELIVVEDDGSRTPFSRGILARSLTTVGLAPTLAHELAVRAEEQLWSLERQELGRDDVRDAIDRLLVEHAGEDFARRFEQMRSVRHPGRPIVVLVGGSPGVGKSELAAELAYRFSIPRVVSSDSVREALRSLIGPDLSPVLHASSYTAWMADLLPAELRDAVPKRRRVVRGFNNQVVQVGTALDAIVARHVTEATSLVLEGIHVVPGISPVRTEGALVVSLMLYVDDEDEHFARFGRREGRTRAKRPSQSYEDHFQEIRMLQTWLLETADAAGVPTVEVSDMDDAVERSVELILDLVMDETDGAVEANQDVQAVGS
jgi:2-phosphoglycerate kinase